MTQSSGEISAPLDMSLGKSQHGSDSMNPAEYVIHVFDGVRATARAIGRSPSSVSKWQKPRAERGCNGQIPSAAQLLILKKAKELALDVTPDDLIYGRKISKRNR